MKKYTFAHIAESMGISVENLDQGKLEKEMELTLYVHMNDLQDLSRAVSKEIHEQYGVPLETETKVKQRIRAINNKRWLLAVKSPLVGKPGNYECELDISNDMFKLLRSATPEDGYVKERYFFPITGTELVWEVDVFRNNGGTQHEWVKVDLEFTDTTMEVPPLPFKTKAIIFSDKADLTNAEKDWIDQLWDSEWQKTKLTT